MVARGAPPRMTGLDEVQALNKQALLLWAQFKDHSSRVSIVKMAVASPSWASRTRMTLTQIWGDELWRNESIPRPRAEAFRRAASWCGLSHHASPRASLMEKSAARRVR